MKKKFDKVELTRTLTIIRSGGKEYQGYRISKKIFFTRR